MIIVLTYVHLLCQISGLCLRVSSHLISQTRRYYRPSQFNGEGDREVTRLARHVEPAPGFRVATVMLQLEQVRLCHV